MKKFFVAMMAMAIVAISSIAATSMENTPAIDETKVVEAVKEVMAKGTIKVVTIVYLDDAGNPHTIDISEPGTKGQFWTETQGIPVEYK